MSTIHSQAVCFDGQDVEHCAAVAASPDQEVVAAGGAEASAVQL